MKGMKVLVALTAVLCLAPMSSGGTDGGATPQEVVEKVREAASFLMSAGEAGLLEFAARDGRWVWKDSYVWVLKCGDMTDVAHPINPTLVGRNLAGLKDVEGNLIFMDMCRTSENEAGGWVEYWWPKVGQTKPFRKVAYVLQVPGSPYQVAAGIYDETVSLNELNGMLK